jgi:hypothetical protein
MGGDVWQQSNINTAKNGARGQLAESHKHHKNTESMVTGFHPVWYRMLQLALQFFHIS